MVVHPYFGHIPDADGASEVYMILRQKRELLSNRILTWKHIIHIPFAGVFSSDAMVTQVKEVCKEW